MKKIFTLSVIMGCLTFISYGQDLQTQVNQQSKDPVTKEMAAKADVVGIQPEVTSAITHKQLVHQQKILRLERKLIRRQQKFVSHRRLRHNFHHQHTLIRRR